MLPEGPLAFPDAFGHLDPEHDIKIAPSADAQGHALPSDPHFLHAVGPGRDLNADATAQSRHRNLGAEYSFPRGQVQVEIEVIALDAVIGMFSETDAQEETSERSSQPSFINRLCPAETRLKEGAVALDSV